jgi:hypothetical protein
LHNSPCNYSIVFYILFNVFVDKVIRQWQDVLKKDFKIGNTILNTILLVDDQAVFIQSEDDVQRAINKLEKSK